MTTQRNKHHIRLNAAIDALAKHDPPITRREGRHGTFSLVFEGAGLYAETRLASAGYMGGSTGIRVHGDGRRFFKLRNDGTLNAEKIAEFFRQTRSAKESREKARIAREDAAKVRQAIVEGVRPLLPDGVEAHCVSQGRATLYPKTFEAYAAFIEVAGNTPEEVIERVKALLDGVTHDGTPGQ